MKIEIPVSAGELLDKLTILVIKRTKGLDVDTELDLLEGKVKESLGGGLCYFSPVLKAINLQLWDIESLKRTDSPRGSTQYSDLSLLTLQLNDIRYQIKKAVDVFYGSEISEEKDHSKR
tara:strand:- start:1854 stop:2210 length:357 start_codon:yes stop_codon:yes gene_type:complete